MSILSLGERLIAQDEAAESTETWRPLGATGGGSPTADIFQAAVLWSQSSHLTLASPL